MVCSRSALLVAALLSAGIGVGAGPGGCASAPTHDARTPDDLTIEVTVLRGAGVQERPEAHRRPARYVLFADGSLHYGGEFDRDFHAGSAWLPAPTRSVAPETMDVVWSVVDRLGLMDSDATLPPLDLARIEAAPGMTTYVVAVTAGRRSRVRIDRVPDDPDARGSTVDLVRLLAALAWATDQPDAHVVTAPRRYDFGPDPYARFREP